VQGQSRTYDLIEYALGSIANLVIVPMQDYLQLSNEEGRMNVPATAQGNWGWRISPRYDTPKLRRNMLTVAQKNKREK
jgi:4-alpha-glucanotransferase